MIVKSIKLIKKTLSIRKDGRVSLEDLIYLWSSYLSK